MFSTNSASITSIITQRNSALVSHSDGLCTRSSASTNRSNDLQNDLIAFLSIVQRYNVIYLSTTWQPSLSTLGVGGSGTINQSTFASDMHLAFKRFHNDRDSEMDFLPLMSEVLILSQPPIQNHPNIVNLEGICWEIKPRTEKAVPVLVFEKAAWDLQQFANVGDGMNMSIDEKLKICADIGSAITTLHAYGVIHGDIKPQNVLVYKDSTGKTTVKVTDFGYSTLATGEAGPGRVFLPKSRPWNAPEHHFEEFTAVEAKKTDIYSFGMLCFWFLFGHNLSDIPQSTTEGTTELISFNAPVGPPTLLEQFKATEKLDHIVNQFLDSRSLAGLNADHRNRLKEIFSVTVTLNLDKRSSDFRYLLDLLSQERTELQAATLMEESRERSWHADFRIAKNLFDFVQADYRVRIQIRECLEANYLRNKNQSFAPNIAFQLAFCYHIGFGVHSDHDKCHTWLAKSDKQPVDLEIEKEEVLALNSKNERTQRIHWTGKVVATDLVHEYRTWGLNHLERAKKEYEREVADMILVFGEAHFVSLSLYETIGHLLDALGDFEKSKMLRIRIRDETQKANRISNPYYTQWMRQVAISHVRLGEWAEALQLQEEVLKLAESTQSSEVSSIKNDIALSLWSMGRLQEAEKLEVEILASSQSVFGQEHPKTLSRMSNLAMIYVDQGRWKEAVELFVEVMETSKRVHGQEHPDTLRSMSNLATIYNKQGKRKESEQLLVQVIDTSKRVLGHDHPNTLSSMANLAVTYSDNSRGKEATELFVLVMKTQKRVLGQEHPDTLVIMNNLAWAYRAQGQLKEAENLLVQVMETTKRVFGEKHPLTLASMNKLASLYQHKLQWKKVEELFVQVMETCKQVLGPDHPSTLTSMGNLAGIYQTQRRLKEAEVLEVETLERRKRVLGQDHSDTLTSMGNLASTYSNQGRWNEAEELLVQVMETSKRVLGHEHSSTLQSMHKLASTYKDKGQLKEAEELLVHVIETQKRVLGQGHSDTLTSMNKLVLVYQNLGRWTKAEELCVQVVETSKRVLGQDHPDTLHSMASLAMTYMGKCQWKEAEEHFVQVMEKSKRMHSQEHPFTVAAIANVCFIRAQMFCEASRRLPDENRYEHGLGEERLPIQPQDDLLQFAIARYSECSNNVGGGLRSSPKILQKSDDDDDQFWDR